MEVTSKSALHNAVVNDEQFIKLKGEAMQLVKEELTTAYHQFKGIYLFKYKERGFLDAVFASKLTKEESETLRLIREYYIFAGEGNSYIQMQHK